MREDEDILRSKYMGHSIIVSAFLCPCYGLLQLSDEQLLANSHIEHKEAFVLRSVQADGYWKVEHILDQLINRAIPIFEVLHPGCIGIFCFDQLTNHNAMAEDALIATRINLSSSGGQHKMRNGWYMDEYGERRVQSMVFSNNYPVTKLRRQPKGIKQVLQERNFWPAKGVHLMCKQCSGKHDDVPSKVNCCARRIMSLQPDFSE